MPVVIVHDHLCFRLADVLGVGPFSPKCGIDDLFHFRADSDPDADIPVFIADRLEAGAVGKADDAPGLQTGKDLDKRLPKARRTLALRKSARPIQ